MKVVQQTPTRLVLREYPLELWLNGGLAAVMSLVLLFVGAELTTFNCHRLGPTTGRCELVTASLRDPERWEIGLDELQGARLESSGLHNVEQVVLLTTRGDIPLTRYQGLPTSKERAVDQINAFVSDPTIPTLTIRPDGWALAFIIGLAVFTIIASAVFLVKSQIATCTFDKTLGRLTLVRRGLLGTQVSDYAICEIVDVQIDKRRFKPMSVTVKPHWICRISLIIGPGERVPLTPFLSRGLRTKQQTADRICAFLGLKVIEMEGDLAF